MAPLLEVKNLRTSFKREDGLLTAVDGVSFSLAEGETLGIVGESGSGKSVSVMSLLGLLRQNGEVTGGEALFNGQDLFKMSNEERRQIRGKDISMIFQDPMSSLNPTLKIGRQLMEPTLWHKLGGPKDARKVALDLLRHVGIPEYESRFGDYPFQFSGGMRQRVMIAMAMTCSPKLLIADEPTTALDVTIRMQILNLMATMQEEYKTSIIMITHDFGMASNFCDKIMVMYAGKVMESAPASAFLKGAQHPYSLGLMRSVIDLDSEEKELHTIPGTPPNMINPPKGCRFHPRCERCLPICTTVEPMLVSVGDGHQVACHLAQGVENHG